jgi:hypothetical protein
MALQIPAINKYCTCTDRFYVPTRLGMYQRQYETLKLKSTTREALNAMGIKRLCCREGIFNPPILFFNSENEGKIRDEINLMAGVEGGSKKKNFGFYLEDSPDILPKKPLPVI